MNTKEIMSHFDKKKAKEAALFIQQNWDHDPRNFEPVLQKALWRVGVPVQKLNNNTANAVAERIERKAKITI